MLNMKVNMELEHINDREILKCKDSGKVELNIEHLLNTLTTVRNKYGYLKCDPLVY